MKLKQLSAYGISRLVLYVVLGVAAVVYGLFLLVGYSMPSDVNPSFTAPLLTPLLIGFVELMVVVAIAIAVWMGLARVRSIKSRKAGSITSVRIMLGVALGTIVLLLLSFALGSTAPIMANGTTYTDGLWLRVADMFIYSGAVLIVVATVAASVLKGKRLKK